MKCQLQKVSVFAVFLLCVHAKADILAAQIVAECKRQMSLGICITRQDRSVIDPDKTMMIAGVGRVKYSAYLDYTDLYNPQKPTDPAMCNLAQQHLISTPNDDHSKIARSLWSPPLNSEHSNQDQSIPEKWIRKLLGLM